VTNIDELKEVIRKLHGVDSNHVESVPITETFKGQTVWDGIVEVFDLVDHPKACRAYAWTHDTDGPDQQRRHITVLHVDPITSPILAVRAAIVREFRSHEQTEET
jgi:hypothetical protein